MSKPAAAKPEARERCSKRIYGDIFSGHACRLKVTVQRDGHWWCKLHDPLAVKKRRDARDAKWEAKWAAQDAAEKRREAIQDARSAVIEAAKAWRTVADLDYPSAAPYFAQAAKALADAVAKLEALDAVHGGSK